MRLRRSWKTGLIVVTTGGALALGALAGAPVNSSLSAFSTGAVSQPPDSKVIEQKRGAVKERRDAADNESKKAEGDLKNAKNKEKELDTAKKELELTIGALEQLKRFLTIRQANVQVAESAVSAWESAWKAYGEARAQQEAVQQLFGEIEKVEKEPDAAKRTATINDLRKAVSALGAKAKAAREAAEAAGNASDQAGEGTVRVEDLLKDTAKKSNEPGVSPTPPLASGGDAANAALVQEQEEIRAQLNKAREKRLGRQLTTEVGPHIEYPRFVGQGPEIAKEGEVIGDRLPSPQAEVISAVCNLYYSRDAHRVSQIINRQTRSYNAAAVNITERAAENARDLYQAARAARREAEDEAIEAARKLRAEERKRKDLEAELAKVRADRFFGLAAKGKAEHRIAELDSKKDAAIGPHLARYRELEANANKPVFSDVELQKVKDIEAGFARHGMSDDDIAELIRLETADPANQQEKDRLDKFSQHRKQPDVAPDDHDWSTYKKLRARRDQAAKDAQELTRLRNRRDAALKPDEQAEYQEQGLALRNFEALAKQQQGVLGALQEAYAQSVSDTSGLDKLRDEATEKNQSLQRAAYKEDRAKENQFRLEVLAARTDPDTFAAGDVNSVDPVTQVSISVIGEAVIHLRGPRLGVNKVREMIHQIDQPVGQVKIGIMTVQVNGERGDRMERTVRRIEGNLSRARFLTYISKNLFTQAVIETAWRAAGQPVPDMQHLEQKGYEDNWIEAMSEPARIERWRRYQENFFGQEFLRELRDIDDETSVLDPFHKLLSLNSMDTVTMGEALFIAALSKKQWRNEILARFTELVQTELPRKEGQWIVTNEIHHHMDPRWWGDATWGRGQVFKEANRKYTFEAVRSFFESRGDDFADDLLTPFQREVVKLLQGYWSAGLLGRERDLKLQQMAVLCASARDGAGKGKGTARLNRAQWVLLETQLADVEERYLQLLEGLRGRKAAVDNLIKRVYIALEDDVNAQFYDPAIRRVREASREWDVELGQVERTTILTNNRAFGKVEPQATMEFDLPKRDILIIEAMKAASALTTDMGALLQDPSFLALTSLMSGAPVASGLAGSAVDVLPGTGNSPSAAGSNLPAPAKPKFGAAMDALIPDPAIYKFETGTGFEIRPVVQPDGQSVVFTLDYMYTTDLLEPVRADEKHLGRVKRHFINTEVQLGNLEWREISRYEVALKAARNSRGVPLLEDVPGLGILFRPLPQAKKSLQQNVIIGQAALYPTVDDLIGLKSPALADLPVGARAWNRWEAAECKIETLQQAVNQEVEKQVMGALQQDKAVVPAGSSPCGLVPCQPATPGQPKPDPAKPAPASDPAPMGHRSPERLSRSPLTAIRPARPAPARRPPSVREELSPPPQSAAQSDVVPASHEVRQSDLQPSAAPLAPEATAQERGGVLRFLRRSPDK